MDEASDFRCYCRGGCFFLELKGHLCEAVRVYTRYDTIGDDGITRRERNTRMGLMSDAFYLPDSGRYLWEWFGNLNSSVSRIEDGLCRAIPPSEYYAWSKMTGTIVYPVEYDILTAMDLEYCKELNKELAANREKSR